MKHFSELNNKEKQQLLKFPAFISLLASTAVDGIDKQEKKAAVKLTHIRTYSCDPALSDFYKEADEVFEKTITDLNNELPHNKEDREHAILKELKMLEPILDTLDPDYASVLRRSIQSYKHHISRAHRNILEYFIFPLPIEGLTD